MRAERREHQTQSARDNVPSRAVLQSPKASVSLPFSQQEFSLHRLVEWNGVVQEGGTWVNKILYKPRATADLAPPGKGFCPALASQWMAGRLRKYTMHIYLFKVDVWWFTGEPFAQRERQHSTKQCRYTKLCRADPLAGWLGNILKIKKLFYLV